VKPGALYCAAKQALDDSVKPKADFASADFEIAQTALRRAQEKRHGRSFTFDVRKRID
jgi:hypothetical protein